MATLSTASQKFSRAVSMGLQAIWQFFVVDYWPLNRLYGYKLDDANGQVRLNLSYGEKDGTSLFTTLATFALGQGAALAALAKGDYERVALVIYGLAFVLTVSWIASLLRSVIDVDDPAQVANLATARAEAARVAASQAASLPGATPVVAAKAAGKAAATAVRAAAAAFGPTGSVSQRTYNEATVRYGRWVMSWALMSGAIVFILARFSLLPAQVRIEEYDLAGPIRVDTLDGSELARGVAGSQANRTAMDFWLYAILAKPEPTVPNRKFYWVRSKEPFKKAFKSFSVDLRYSEDKCRVSKIASFLYRELRAGNYEPVYRQLPLRGDVVKEVIRLDVDSPEPGEFLMFWVYAEGLGLNDPAPTSRVCNFWIEPHTEGPRYLASRK